jgi:murein DD-endopeptidase MepM/ murein hydrolase activator NlpD
LGLAYHHVPVAQKFPKDLANVPDSLVLSRMHAAKVPANILLSMKLEELLKSADTAPVQVVKFEAQQAVRLDLSKHNHQLQQIDLNDAEAFSTFINRQIADGGGSIGWGGYLEERGLYSRSALFQETEPRTIHLGIDIWAAAGTSVFAPLDGVVHSFDNRKIHGDYGPVIILRHCINDQVFHTLYGHLSTASLQGLQEGQHIEKGQCFASLGVYEENFHWPPHLHFQAIMDMQGQMGDYPGVCRKSEQDYYQNNCPDPDCLVLAPLI